MVGIDREKYLYQSIYRTKVALKIIDKSHRFYSCLRGYLDLAIECCDFCTRDTWEIQNLISKPELNGKICDIVETLDNGRVKIRVDDLTITVKPECLVQNKGNFLVCGRCKLMVYCNAICQKSYFMCLLKH